jgi:hypothetical protein
MTVRAKRTGLLVYVGSCGHTIVTNELAVGACFTVIFALLILELARGANFTSFLACFVLVRSEFALLALVLTSHIGIRAGTTFRTA